MANGKACDVFISHSAVDAPLAREISDAFRANGLNALPNGDLPGGDAMEDALWNALAECRAMLIILSPSGLSAAMLIEIGAIQAWNKPVHGIVRDPTSTHIPSFLSHIPLITSNRIDEVIRAVESRTVRLDPDDRSKLVGIYQEIGATMDALIVDTRLRKRLTRRFTTLTGKVVSDDVLVMELLRMRKQGEFNVKPRVARPRRKISSAQD
jgi:TIR domain